MGRSAEEIPSVSDGLESRRAQGALSRSDATAGVAFGSGVVDDAKAMADSNKSLILGFDDCLDESCAGGTGSSAAIAELVGNAGLAEMSGEVQVRTFFLGFDDSSEEFFGGSDVGPPKAHHVARSNVGPWGSVAVRTSRDTRCSRNDTFLDRQIDESRAFQPDDVDSGLCQALRIARVQCHSAKIPGTEYCRVHQRKQYHGCVRGALSAQVLARFRDGAVKKEKKNKTRHSS